MASVVLSITTVKCGLNAHTSLHLSPVNLERKYLVGHPEWTLLSSVWNHLYQKIKDCLLADPNHNKPFNIYTNAPNEAYIVQCLLVL